MMNTTTLSPKPAPEWTTIETIDLEEKIQEIDFLLASVKKQSTVLLAAVSKTLQEMAVSAPDFPFEKSERDHAALVRKESLALALTG